MKTTEKLNVAKYFEKRLLADLHVIYSEYILDVESPEEWEKVEENFLKFCEFVKYGR